MELIEREITNTFSNSYPALKSVERNTVFIGVELVALRNNEG